jgi:hypothetical protein
VAVHPQEQVGRLTARLPSFSGRIVMLWVTLVIFLLLPEESLPSIDHGRRGTAEGRASRYRRASTAVVSGDGGGLLAPQRG